MAQSTPPTASRLGRERAPAVVASAVLGLALFGALALRWPAVHGGYQDDDYIQAAMLEGRFWIERGPFDLFWFGGRNAEEQRTLLDHGYLPWWAHPQHRVAMMRPFASGLLALEHALGLGAYAQHVIALGLLALCLWTAHRFLKQLLPPAVAGLATLLYGLDEAHGAPATWLANRSTLISTAFAFLALAGYVRARRAGPRAPRALLGAFAWLTLAFASGEYGFFALGYIVAFELLGVEKPAPRAALAAVGLAAAFTAIGALLGYGVISSGFYISPFREPLRFADAMAVRLPALALDLTLGVPARWVQQGFPLRELALERGWLDARQWYELPSYPLVAAFLVVPVLIGLAWTARELVRRDAALAPLRWLLLGACIALVPAAGALPSPRLTGGSALAFAALFAALLVRAGRYLYDAVRREPSTSASRVTFAALLVLAIAFAHGLLPADRALGDARSSVHRARTVRSWALHAELPAELPANAQVWLTSASDFSTAVHIPWIRLHAGLPRIERFHLLSGAARAHDLIRIDDRTLEVQVLASDPGRAFKGSLYRSETAAFHDGDAIALPGFNVRVLATVDGDPFRIRFTSDRSLDDPSIILLCPEPTGIHRCAMPAPGFVLRLPRAPLPWGDPNLRYTKTVRPL